MIAQMKTTVPACILKKLGAGDPHIGYPYRWVLAPAKTCFAANNASSHGSPTNQYDCPIMPKNQHQSGCLQA